jgi:peptide/nickel transport system permease protein
VLITVGAGLPLGLLAGSVGGAVDEAIMRAMDVLLAFPGLLLILGLVAVLGAGSRSLAVAVGVAGVPTFGRLVRSAVLSVRDEPYVEAARAVGCRPGRIIARHILPNVLGPVIAFATVQFGWAILNASTTSFLGLGESPSIPEWGTMLNLGRGYLRIAPWVSAAPGLAITVTVLAANLLGDGLQRLFDPVLRR